MTKRFPLFLLLVVLMTSFAFSQTRNVKNERMQIPDPQVQVTVADPSFVPNTPLVPGEEFVQTGYDYMCNTAGDKIKRSRAIEELLRPIVPSKSLSVTTVIIRINSSRYFFAKISISLETIPSTSILTSAHR